MKVAIVGSGYVGLVTGVCLAHIGHDVICIDNDVDKVALMQSGKPTIYEPGLAEIMQSSIASHRLKFTTDLKFGVEFSEVIFIAVGTPSLPNGKTDTRYVESVARDIGLYLNDGYRVIVNKSTVPIGSGGWVRSMIEKSIAGRSEVQGNIEFEVVSNPEFLREGNAIYDTFNPERIVLGTGDDRATRMMTALYEPIIERRFAEDSSLPLVPVVVTDTTSAEMIKYAANSFLVTKVSFINEIANICELVGADVTQVAHGIGLDSRIGSKFLKAGIGWGGSCFPKDMSALIGTAEEYGYDAQLLKASIQVNQYQRLKVIGKLQQELKVIKGKTIGILGLTFKPNTDDLRDAPSLDIISKLQELGATIKAYDPMVNSIKLNNVLDGINLVDSPEELCRNCDALILVTDWGEFSDLDYASLAQKMNNKLIVDGRNFLNKSEMVEKGFKYIGIGC
jgi:UDPglucose 6-dehydrogenase